MTRLFVLLGLMLSVQVLQAQYEFTVVKDCRCTDVKNQQRTGTCWSFSTISFLESELIRQGKGYYDLSEMFIVRNIYRDKARNYFLRQGKAQFGQGSLAHDVVRAAEMAGLVPESVYSGKPEGVTYYDHTEMEAVLKAILDAVISQKRPSQRWWAAFDATLDAYMGPVPETFEVDGVTYSPRTFAERLGIRAEDYVGLTSFTHHPWYRPFVLEIPDNYSNGAYLNVPIDELEQVVDYAIEHGFSVAWDGDVSEPGFSQKHGLALVPQSPSDEMWTHPVDEVEVTQAMRQETFESYQTTDDHLMHLVGIAKDQNGKKYYIIKNSWGPIGPYEGYLYMSEPYFRLKTVSIYLHRDGLPPALREKLSL